MIGEVVGNFEIVGKIGQGGMGEVFVAEHTTIKTRVAIKTLLPHISANKDQVQRFFNEAIAVSQIMHAGIVKIFDAGFMASGQAYLVMELLNGETLASRIRRCGRLPLGQLSDIGRQIANVLEATHQAGITHRDLKPDNVFLVRDVEMEHGERVKILDFGIAKLANAGITTTSVATMGTPGYMAPEQWHNAKNIDWRADAYSLGCLTYEMASGAPPFRATSIAEACTQHLTATPPSICDVVRELPLELGELVSRLLAKEPGQRPASMKEVTQTFARLGVGQPRVPDPKLTTAGSGAFATTLASASGATASPPVASQEPVKPSTTTLGTASGEVQPRARTVPIVGVALGGVALGGLVVLFVLSSRENKRATDPPPQRAMAGGSPGLAQAPSPAPSAATTDAHAAAQAGSAKPAHPETSADVAARENTEGRDLMYAGKYADASAKFRDAAARVPGPLYLYNLCASLFQEGRFGDALAACDSAGKANADDALKAKIDKMAARIHAQVTAQGGRPVSPATP